MAVRVAFVQMTAPDRTVTLTALVALLLLAVACGTTDPASSERLPPIQTTTPTTSTTTTTVAPGDIVYVVQSGDTLGKIAQCFSVTVPSIMERNALTSDAIQAGQTLEIPDAMVIIDPSGTGTAVTCAPPPADG